MCNLRDGKFGNLDRLAELDMKLLGPKGLFEKYKIDKKDSKKISQILNKIIKVESDRLEPIRQYDFSDWPQPRKVG